MNWGTTVNTLIFVIGTFAAILEGIYLSKRWVQKLPEHTRLALEQFARQAVLQVEQQAKDLSNPAKKQLAIVAVNKLLQSFNLPALSPEAVDIAIEAAVFILPDTNKVDAPKPNV